MPPTAWGGRDPLETSCSAAPRYAEDLGFKALLCLAAAAHERELRGARAASPARDTDGDLLLCTTPSSKRVWSGSGEASSTLGAVPAPQDASDAFTPSSSVCDHIDGAPLFPGATAAHLPHSTSPPPVGEKVRRSMSMASERTPETTKAAITSSERWTIIDAALDPDEGPGTQSDALRRFLRGPMELAVNALVFVCVVLVCVELEVGGHALAGPDTGDLDVLAALFVAEHIINALFVLEAALRLFVFRLSYFWDETARRVNAYVVDVSLVAITSLDLYVLQPTRGKSASLQAFRLIRLLRISRVFRFFRIMASFAKLRILLGASVRGIASLFWAMPLLIFSMFGCAMFLSASLTSAIHDEALPLDLRLWAHRYYGTGLRAMWTLFEITFSGGWPSYARRLVEEVHWSYMLFFIVYIVCVVFALTRIVAALLLRDTLLAASEDTNMLVWARRKEKERHVQELLALFEELDTSQDRRITIDQFMEALRHPAGSACIGGLGVPLFEACAIFDLLDLGDGHVSYDDLCLGLMRIKGQARELNAITMMRDFQRILDKCDSLERQVAEALR